MKKRVLSDVRIVCDPPACWAHHAVFKNTSDRLQALAKEYEKWVSDFDLFIRDHRSQDPVNLSVEREYTNICSYCGLEWETDDMGCPVCCQEAIEEWENAKKLETVK